jgi:hypothetical protein
MEVAGLNFLIEGLKNIFFITTKRKSEEKKVTEINVLDQRACYLPLV